MGEGRERHRKCKEVSTLTRLSPSSTQLLLYPESQRNSRKRILENKRPIPASSLPPSSTHLIFNSEEQHEAFIRLSAGPRERRGFPHFHVLAAGVPTLVRRGVCVCVLGAKSQGEDVANRNIEILDNSDTKEARVEKSAILC